MKSTRRALLGSALMIVCGLGLTACGGGSSDDDTLMPGTLYFSQDDNGNGLFVVDTASGAATLAGLGDTGTTSSTIGLTGNGSVDSLYGSTFTQIRRISADGSASSEVQAESSEGLAFSTSTGLLYSAINGVFQSIDPVGGTTTPLAAPGSDIEGLACDSSRGIVYAISRADNDLYRYEIATDTWSTVGDTGVNWSDPGLAYDPVTGRLYAIGNGGNLHWIDPTNANTTVIGPMNLPSGREGGGLGMTAPR